MLMCVFEFLKFPMRFDYCVVVFKVTLKKSLRGRNFVKTS